MRWTPLARLGLISIIILACFSWAGPCCPRTALAQDSFEPVLLESNEKGLSLSWTPPPYNLTLLEVDGDLYSQLHMPNTTLSAQPGYPELPLFSSLIGLPAAGAAQLRLLEVERDIVQLPHPPLPAPIPQPVHPALLDPQSLPTAGPTNRSPDPAIYSADAFYPAGLADLGPAQQMRDLRLARLTINPLRVNPVTNQMEVIRYLRLEITFDQAASSSASLNAQAGSTTFAQALTSTLINPEAIHWSAPIKPRSAVRSTAQPTDRPTNQPTNQLTNQPTKVIVTATAGSGLYVLTYNDLHQAGLPLDTLDPRTLQLSHGQPPQEVAIWVEGQADGVFNTGDYLLFYAEPEFSRFTDEDVYFLNYGQTTGLRMASQSASPAGLSTGTAWRTTVAELNQYYDPHYPGRDGDYWYWDELRQPDKTSATYAITLDPPLTTGPPATLTLWLQGYTDPFQNPDHRLAVSVNGTAVGQHTWNGTQAIEANFSVPAANLKAGANQVTLSLPGLSGLLVEGAWFDALALTYPIGQATTTQLAFQGEAGRKAYTLTGWPGANLQVYDITDPNNPRRLTHYNLIGAGSTYTLQLGDTATTPANYLVVPPGSIKTPLALEAVTPFNDPAKGADYIIITHSDFAEAVAPLATHRARQGLRVVTVDVRAIYDTYGAGRLDPAAIKTFLQHAYTTWTPPAPTYVLLVGDGTYDFKNYSRYNTPTFIPPYMAHVDPWWGETAADNQFVTLAGDDPLPELLIGRLPVNTPTEAAIVVNKIVGYEADPFAGGWNAHHLFVSDNPDSAGNFHADSDQGYHKVKAPFIGHRFYYSQTPGPEPHLYTDAETLRRAFLRHFNQGASLVTFHGHSSWLQWAVEGLFRYHWSTDPALNDVITLGNQYALPVVLEMTCFTGSFHRPEYATLDESLLRLPDGGAVAVWGSTGLGVSTGHLALQAGFYRTIVDQAETNLGAATLAGKMDLYATGFHQDLLDTFILFGDPALNMNFTIVPFSNQLYLPLTQKGS